MIKSSLFPYILYFTVSFVGIKILKNGTFSSYLYGGLSLFLSKNLSKFLDLSSILASIDQITEKVMVK